MNSVLKYHVEYGKGEDLQSLVLFNLVYQLLLDRAAIPAMRFLTSLPYANPIVMQTLASLLHHPSASIS